MIFILLIILAFIAMYFILNYRKIAARNKYIIRLKKFFIYSKFIIFFVRILKVVIIEEIFIQKLIIPNIASIQNNKLMINYLI